MYFAISILVEVLRLKGAGIPAPRLKRLGEYCNQVLPLKAPRTSLNDVVVVAAAPRLRAFARSFQRSVKDRLSQSAKRFSNFLYALFVCFFEVHKVADAIPHLTFGFFNEESLRRAHKGGTRLEGDNLNVASDEGVVGGGGDNGVHIKWG